MSWSFSASYSKKLFGWDGIKRAFTLFREPFAVSLNDLVELIRQQGG